MKLKKFSMAGDLFYTTMAVVISNIVLQLIVYPLITHFQGENVTGNILYFVGFIYIIPQAFGSAFRNARLIIRKEHDATNRDYAPTLYLLCILSALICGYIGLADSHSLSFSVGYGIFSVLYFLRNYAEVEFRLTLKFKEYFLYFCIISLGYLIGLGLYFLTNQWLLIFTVGEGLAVLYSFVRGNIFKKEPRGIGATLITKTFFIIVVSILMRDCVLHFDKVILKQLISADVVTHYYVVSFLAKTMQMLIAPLTTLIMSYLTAKDAVFSRKLLLKFTGFSFVICALFFSACIVGTPLYIKIFYHSLYDEIISYNIIVNLGLIIGFISLLFMSVLLSQGLTKSHTVIECVWSACYIFTAYHFVASHGIWGLAYVTLYMNIIKLIVVLAVLFFTTKGNKEKASLPCKD